MKKYHIIIILFLCFTLWSCAQIPKEPQISKDIQSPKINDSYVIGTGDILDISLWRDDALMKQVIVLPDGKISYPLVGEVMAAGKTIAELKKDITNKLVDYVPDPVILIEVKQSGSMIIYVTGRVIRSGHFPVNTNVTVLQAISMAGGLNPFAKRNKIKIFRQEGDKTKVFFFNYDEVVDGKNLDQNIILKRGDVIVVP